MKAVLTMANGMFRSEPIEVPGQKEIIYMELNPSDSGFRRNDTLDVLANSVMGIFKLHGHIGLVESGKSDEGPIYEHLYEYRLSGFRK